jgi:hypothetical protein
MSDPSKPAPLSAPSLVETPFSEWSLDNVYEDPVESYGRYVDFLRESYLSAGQYTPQVERTLQFKLQQVLNKKNLLTAENVDEVNAKLGSLHTLTHYEEAKGILGDTAFEEDTLAKTGSLEGLEDLKVISAYVGLADLRAGDDGQDGTADDNTHILEDYDYVGLDEAIRNRKEERYTTLFERGEIPAAAYIDEEGEEQVLVGPIPEGLTPEDVIRTSAQYGIRPRHLFELQRKRTIIPFTGTKDNPLMYYELEARSDAEADVLSALEEKSKAGRIMRAQIQGIAQEFGVRTSYEWGDKAYKNVGGVFGAVGTFVGMSWDALTGDDKEWTETEDRLEHEKRIEDAADDVEETRIKLIRRLVDETGLSEEVLGDVVHDISMKLAMHGDGEDFEPSLLYSDEEEDLAQGVIRTRYSGALVQRELQLKPELFRKALTQAGFSEAEIEAEDVRRQLVVAQEWDVYNDTLSEDGTWGEKWQEAVVEGTQIGLTNTQILESFIRKNDDVSFKSKGFWTSVGHAFSTLYYGGAVIGGSFLTGPIGLSIDSLVKGRPVDDAIKRWGQEGLISNAESVAHNRQMAGIWGIEMGLGQEISEQVAPMAVDAVITVGAALLTVPSGGSSAAVTATYFSAKASATAAARSVLSAAARGALKKKVTRDAAGKLIKESTEEVADRLLKAQTLKGVSKETTLAAVKAYNGKLGKTLGIGAAQFVPAATRSGINSYGAVFRTTQDKLTAMHTDPKGNWHEGWDAERVREESHKAGFGAGLVGGTITGIITAGLGTIGGGKFGGLETAYLKGLSYRQLKAVSQNIIGRQIADEPFQKVLKDSIKSVMRKNYGRFAAQLGRSVVGEGFEEGLDEFVNGFVQDAWANETTSFRERVEQAFHAALIGGIMGAGAPLAGATARNITPNKMLFNQSDAVSFQEQIRKEYTSRVAKDKKLSARLKKLKETAPETSAEVETILDKYEPTEDEEDSESGESSGSGSSEAPSIESTPEVTAAAEQLELELGSNLTSEKVDQEVANQGSSREKTKAIDPEVASSEAVQQILKDSEGESTSGQVAVSNPDPSKTVVHTPEQKYKFALSDIDRKEALWKERNNELQQLPEGDRLTRGINELVEAENSSRVLSPEKAAHERRVVEKLFKEEQLQDSTTQPIGDEDISSLEDLAEHGFPVTILASQLEQLGISISNTSKSYLKQVTQKLAAMIRAKYPVIKRAMPKGGAKIPKTFAAAGNVYLNSRGEGVFNNDPIGMLTLLENNIAIPVEEDMVSNPQVNKAFKFKTIGDQTYVDDIMLPVSGGLLSAKTAFNRVGNHEADYSVIKSLITRLHQARSTTTLTTEAKVKNPFNPKRRVSLPHLLKVVKDLPMMRGIITNDDALNLNKDFTEATAVAMSLEMQAKIYEYAKRLESGEEVDQLPFYVTDVRQTQGRFFAEQQSERSKRATRDLVSMLTPDTDIQDDPAFDAKDNAEDNFVPPREKPLPPIPENQLKGFLDNQFETVIAALEKDAPLRKAVSRLLNTEVHHGQQPPEVSNEKTFDELIHFLASGANITNKSALQFQSELKAGVYAESAAVHKALLLIGLISPSVDKPPTANAEFANLLMEELQGFHPDETIGVDDAVDFYKQMKGAVALLKQRSAFDRRSRERIARSNAAEMEALGLEDGDSETIVTALEKIANGKNKTLAIVAKILLRNKGLLRNTQFFIDPNNGEWAGGFFYDQSGKPTIVINPWRAGGRGIADTLVHECIHAFTSSIVDASPESRTSEQNQAIRRLESLRKLIQKQVRGRSPRQAPSKLAKAGLSNTHEFITYILTSPQFQAFVDRVPIDNARHPYPSESRSFLKRVLEAIGKLLGLSPKDRNQTNQAIADALNLTKRKGMPEPATAAGFRDQVAESVNDAQVGLAQMAADMGLAGDAEANNALNEEAAEHILWARDYLPSELNLLIDETIDVVAQVDPENGAVIFNPRRAAVKLAQVVPANEIDPMRRQHILASILNEEIGRSAAWAALPDEGKGQLAAAMDMETADGVIEEHYPQDEQAAAKERLRSEDPDVATKERFTLAAKQLSIHAGKVLRGGNINEQINFLLENPNLFGTVKQYFKTLLTKIAYHKTAKDISPEMRNAVNHVVRELRALEASYRPAPASMAHNPRNPQEVIDQLVKQAMSSTSLVPPRVEKSDALWEPPIDQEFTAEDTSINEKKPPATFGSLAKKGVVQFFAGGINADIGGGRFDNGTDLLLKDYGATNLIFDHWNREPDHNAEVAETIRDGGADTATVNNVLNVIQEKHIRAQVIQQAANAIGDDGTAYFLIHEGTKANRGVGKETSKGWQNNQKAEYYRSELEAVFGKVERKEGNLFIASEPRVPTLGMEVTPELFDLGNRNDLRVGTANLGTKTKPKETPATSNIGATLWEDNPDPKAAAEIIKKVEEQVAQIAASTNLDSPRARYILPKSFSKLRNPLKKVAALRDFMSDNLVALYNAVDPDIRARSKRWYQGTNRIAHGLAKKYNISAQQVAGVMAALSPQKDWFLNLAQAEQVLEVTQNYRDYVLDNDEYNEVVERTIQLAEAPAARKKGKSPAQKAKLDKEAQDRRAKIFKGLKGKTFAELETAEDKGWAVRLIAETVFGNGVTNVSPEGEPNGPYLKDNGEPYKNGWGSAAETAKAISIVEDGSLENISDSLGGYHKLRNFYNNIISPNGDNGDVTIDTHAVAAVFLMPYSQKSGPVSHNFSGGIPNSPANGLQGTFHMYADAYRQAAEQLGIPVYQLQSITWEAIRAIYPDSTRKDLKFVEEREKIWNENEPAQARKIILGGGGIPAPLWHGTPASGTLERAEAAIGSPAQRKAIAGRGLLFAGREADSGVTDLGVPSPSNFLMQQAADADPEWGDPSAIPDELNVEGQSFEPWIEMLEVPLMDFDKWDITSDTGAWGTTKRWFIKNFARRADRRVVEFFDENKAFVRESKKIVKILQNKHDRTIKEFERNNDGRGIPPELISIASGSNMGSTLTDEQEATVENNFNARRAKANKSKDNAEKASLLDDAEAGKLEDIKKFREKNRQAAIAVRDSALADLLLVSPEMHNIVLELRKLTDELSKMGMELFSGETVSEDFVIAFDHNGGIYITRRFRMFEDNEFAGAILDESDPTYQKERDDAMAYFTRRHRAKRVAEVMAADGMGKVDATKKVDEEIAAQDSKGDSIGRQMMRGFILAYQRGKVRHEITTAERADGSHGLIIDEAKFPEGPLKAVVSTLNKKKDLPAPIRALLGEYGHENGLDNLSHTFIHTASVMANQSLFHKLHELGTKSKEPWLITKKQFESDPEKYGDWKLIESDKGDLDFSPLKGMFVPPQVFANLQDLTYQEGKEAAARADMNERETALQKIGGWLRLGTGYSMALKTLGSTGFYPRNMGGNAFWFGPQTGFYGSIPAMFKEVGGVGGKLLGIDSQMAEDSRIVRAARGSKADLEAELVPLATLNVFGDELEVRLIQNLLTEKTTFEDLNKDATEAGLIGEELEKARKKGIKTIAPELLARMKALGIEGGKTVKSGLDGSLQYLGGIASACDAYHKIGLYQFELKWLIKAAQHDLDNPEVGAKGRYGRLLKADGTPTTAMKTMAAQKTKNTSQSYSKALPLIKRFTASNLSVMGAPFVRFAADIPRTMVQNGMLIYKERNDPNPVIKARGNKRFRGALGTHGITMALPYMLKAMFGIGDDEEEALRQGLPFYSKNNTFLYYKTETGLWRLDLTYLNPFAIVQAPFARMFEHIVRGEPIEGVAQLGQLLEPYLSQQILASAVWQTALNEDDFGNRISLKGEGIPSATFKRMFHFMETGFFPRTLSKLIEADTALRGDGDESPLGLLVADALPVKPRKVDPTSEMNRFLKTHTEEYRETTAAMRKILSGMGAGGGKGMTDGQMKRLYNRFARARISANHELIDTMRGFEGLGIPRAERHAAAKSHGVSKERLKLTEVGYMNRPMLTKPMKDILNKTSEGRRRIRLLEEHASELYPDLQIKLGH